MLAVDSVLFANSGNVQTHLNDIYAQQLMDRVLHFCWSVTVTGIEEKNDVHADSIPTLVEKFLKFDT